MKKRYCFFQKRIISFIRLWTVTLLLLVPGQAWAQTRNLPRETSGNGAVGNKAPAAVPGAAAPMNYVRTYTPRVAITSEEQVLKGSVDSVQVSTTYFDGLGRP